MGRPKNFSREEVLEKAMPVLPGNTGFADTKSSGPGTSHRREQVRPLYGVSRQGRPVSSLQLQHYLESQDKRGLLTKEPLGWKNIETFLKNGPLHKGEQQGCFAINSMREFAILPDEAYGAITGNRALLQHLLAMNIEAEKPGMAPSALAELVLSFFSGLCIERNLKSGKASFIRKIENFMTALRGL